MEITIDSSAIQQIREHAKIGYPYEVVGILAGDRSAGRIVQTISLVNERADSQKNRYAVSSLVLFRAEQELENKGLEVVGYYHSHPDHSAQYSDFDREHALPNMCYVIVSVQGQDRVEPMVGEILAWRLVEDRTHMIPDVLVENWPDQGN